jgi:spore maturation protein CgeB
VLNPCNYIFLFDSTLCEKLRLQGISTVYYLPLATNPKRLEQLIPDGQFRESYGCDISFVGSLYNESHHLFERLGAVNPYTKGYLDAIMNAQLSVSGCYLIEELLTENITRELQRVCPYRPAPDGTESDAYVYANYFIARKLAEQERTRILQLLSERYNCMLYTHQPTPELPHIQNMGAIDPYESFPLVCKCSRINLNITLRSIESGIPQRAWDILGAGGFLLTNYQADFDGLFTAGEDYVYYVDDDDLLAKADYYLTHEKERQEIAENGHRKVVSGNTYGHRLRAMLDTMNYPITTTSVL